MKSSAPRWCEIHPWSVSKTQWASGTYTSSSQSAEKTSHPRIVARPAIDPLISATVTMAKPIWKVA